MRTALTRVVDRAGRIGLALMLASLLLVGTAAAQAELEQAEAAQPAAPAVSLVTDVTLPNPMTSLPSEATPAAEEGSSQEIPLLSFFRSTELSGLVDMYFTYNFNQPRTGSSTALRNFDSQHNQFGFALAEVALTKLPTADERVGFRLDLDYGPVTDTVHSFEPGSPDIFRNLQQGYLSYLAPVGTGLQIDVGKFVTQHGAEVIESKDNWNYSRSFMFALAIPYYHSGLRVTYPVNDRLSLAAYLVNGWNNATEDNNGQKTYSVQAVIKPASQVTIIQNYMAGPEQTDNNDDWRQLSDTTVTVAVNDTLSLMGNYDYGRDQVIGEAVTWQGVAGYGRIQATPQFALVPRIEWYQDKDGFTTGLAQTLKEFTLTFELRHSQGLLFRAEYRRDWSDEDFFVKNGGLTENQNTVSFGLVYSFSSAAP